MTDPTDADLMTIDELVGSNILTLRTDAGLSLDEAAILMTIWHWEPWSYERLRRREQGITPVTVAELHAFADLFGVSLFRLLRRQRGIEFLHINSHVLRADEYELDYIWDPNGRTGEAWRVRVDGREAIVARKAGTKAGSGQPFAPGLLDGTTTKSGLKNLAKILRPEAEKIKQAAKKGHSDGDDQPN